MSINVFAEVFLRFDRLRQHRQATDDKCEHNATNDEQSDYFTARHGQS
jgi:hypothetical protein